MTTLAAELSALSKSAEDKHAKDIPAHEATWAQDQYPVLVARFRTTAPKGETEAAVDVPEQSIVGGKFLRGAASALRNKLRKDGFTVLIGQRYDGHPRGEYFLRVQW